MSDSNINVLVSARDEYIYQLLNCMTPIVYQGFKSIYTTVYDTIDDKRYVLKEFQSQLKGIPQWNENIIDEEAERIKAKCSFIHDLISAIFITNVKILSCIRSEEENSKLKIKVPTLSKFIHNVYISCARKFYYNPILFYDKLKSNKVKENHEETIHTIDNCIQDTIRKLIPVENILQEYLASVFNEGEEEEEIQDENEEEEEVESPENDVSEVEEEEFEEEDEDVSPDHIEQPPQPQQNFGEEESLEDNTTTPTPEYTEQPPQQQEQETRSITVPSEKFPKEMRFREEDEPKAAPPQQKDDQTSFFDETPTQQRSEMH